MKRTSVSHYVFAAMGFCMLLGALYFYQNTQDFLKNAVTTNGTVIENERSTHRRKGRSEAVTYHPVIAFKTDNGSALEFTSSAGTNKKTYAKGDVVEVLYLKSSPQEAKMNSFFSLWGVSVILGALGAVFLIVGYSIIFFAGQRRKKIAYLKQNGVAVTALVKEVAVNTKLKVNGKRPYQIIAQWNNPRTSTPLTLKSENIWFDPAPHIKDDKISVLIDRENPKTYYVDISFLPEAIE